MQSMRRRAGIPPRGTTWIDERLASALGAAGR
jgi:hypothetical protein